MTHARAGPAPSRPGKRRYSSMSPTIVLEGGRPVVTLGAPGGAWIGVAVLQVLLNLLDWGMGMQEAVSAPRFSATSDASTLQPDPAHGAGGAGGGWAMQCGAATESYAFAGVHGITAGTTPAKAAPIRSGMAMRPVPRPISA